MKLAEALNLRADIQKRIAQLSERLVLNARVQEGDVPAEDPAELMTELDRLTSELETLIARINLTNSITTYNGKTLTEMIARRDVLSLKNSVMQRFVKTASDKLPRYTGKDIRVISTADVSALRKQTDAMSEEIRTLNVKIQELNWTNELIE